MKLSHWDWGIVSTLDMFLSNRLLCIQTDLFSLGHKRMYTKWYLLTWNRGKTEHRFLEIRLMYPVWGDSTKSGRTSGADNVVSWLQCWLYSCVRCTSMHWIVHLWHLLSYIYFIFQFKLQTKLETKTCQGMLTRVPYIYQK